MKHSEIQELLAAFALDAVDPGEADVVERHLHECPRCRAEVESHRETAAMLAHVGATAPEGLWDRIAANLEEAPPALRLTTLPTSGTVGPAAARAASRWSGANRVLAGLVAAAAVVIGVLGLKIVELDERTRDLPPSDQLALEDAARVAAVDPDAQKVHLVAPDGEHRAEVVVVDGRGYLVHHTLPPLDPDRTYQLWGQAGDVTVSLGVLGSSPKVTAFEVMDGVQALAMTAERSPGVVSSNQPAVVSGWVPPKQRRA
jgi:anti-sigma factor RsiW